MLLDALIGNVVIQAPGCSDLLAVDALRKSAIQLCEQTQAWQETIMQTTQVQDVDLDVPAHSRASAIRRVFVDGELIHPVMPDSVDPFEEPGTPHGYYRIAENVLRMVPAPSAQITLTIDAVLAPTHSANTIPDDLAERCRMPLVWGALAYLLAMPGQSWTQPALAGAYQQMFDQHAANTALNDARGRVRSALRSRASFF